MTEIDTSDRAARATVGYRLGLWALAGLAAGLLVVVAGVVLKIVAGSAVLFAVGFAVMFLGVIVAWVSLVLTNRWAHRVAHYRGVPTMVVLLEIRKLVDADVASFLHLRRGGVGRNRVG